MKSVVASTYQYTSFFDHYFNSDEEWLSKPEQLLVDYVRPNLPDYITTVMNFGCANGRDFIPFQDDYTCIGFDLASPDIIKWACKTDNLIYYQCSIEDYLDRFNHEDLDLSTCLVYVQVTLMYLTREYQNKFIDHLFKYNCKNIVLHEYPPEYTGPHTKFNPDPKYLPLFERKHFRPVVEGQPTGFILMDKTTSNG